MKFRRLFFGSALALVAASAGCNAVDRRRIANTGEDQVVQVLSGDRLLFTLDESDAPDLQWTATCDDGDVDVAIDRDGAAAEVCIRVHRGYDGPSLVTFTRPAADGGKPRSFAIGLFKRTGDAAFWE